MQKNKVVLEINKNEKNFEFICEQNASLGEVIDVLSEMRAYVVNKLNDHIQSEQKPKEEIS